MWRVKQEYFSAKFYHQSSGNLTETEFQKVKPDHTFNFSLDQRLLQLSGGQHVLIIMSMADALQMMESSSYLKITKSQ